MNNDNAYNNVAPPNAQAVAVDPTTDPLSIPRMYDLASDTLVDHMMAEQVEAFNNRPLTIPPTNALEGQPVMFKRNLEQKHCGKWLEANGFHSCSICGTQAFSYIDEDGKEQEHLGKYCDECGSRLFKED